MVECQLSRLLCRIEANGTIANCPNEPPAVAIPSALDRHSTGVCRPIAPRIGPKPAAAIHLKRAENKRMGKLDGKVARVTTGNSHVDLATANPLG